MRTDDPTPKITELRALGMSDTIVLNRLVLEGWAEKDLIMALAPPTLPASAQPVPTTKIIPPATATTTSRSLSAITYASVGLVALAIASSAGVFWFFSKPPVVYSI